MLDLSRLFVVGNQALVRPKSENEMTQGGIILPPGVQESIPVMRGWVLKTGPGLALPQFMPKPEWEEDEPYYLPMQVKEGDLIIFLQKKAIEIEYQNERLFVVPQDAILLYERWDSD
jgi:co-chaperonin GroES (HSP10)